MIAASANDASVKTKEFVVSTSRKISVSAGE